MLRLHGGFERRAGVWRLAAISAGRGKEIPNLVHSIATPSVWELQSIPHLYLTGSYGPIIKGLAFTKTNPYQITARFELICCGRG